ncbi:hypothetical protein Pam2_114 [Pseudanabaena phage Pam2]|nr:hypothetical protein Pam2_114 [Pseudanabaena phage Pam2]
MQDDDPYIEKIRAKFPDYAYFSCDDGYFKVHPEQIDNWTCSTKRASEPPPNYSEKKYDLIAF